MEKKIATRTNETLIGVFGIKRNAYIYHLSHYLVKDGILSESDKVDTVESSIADNAVIFIDTDKNPHLGKDKQIDLGRGYNHPDQAIESLGYEVKISS